MSDRPYRGLRAVAVCCLAAALIAMAGCAPLPARPSARPRSPRPGSGRCAAAAPPAGAAAQPVQQRHRRLLHRPVDRPGRRGGPRRGARPGHVERGLPGRRGGPRTGARRRRARRHGRVGVPARAQRPDRRALPLPQRTAVRHRPGLPVAVGARSPPRAAGSTRPRTGRTPRSGRGCAWTPPPPHPSRSAPRTWPTRSGRSRRAQCRYLFETVIAEIRARDGTAAPVVLGADLNLGSGDSPDLKACLPPGSALVDDGGQQHVVATPEYVVDDHRTIDLRGTTDHPGLLVTLAPAPRS